MKFIWWLVGVTLGKRVRYGKVPVEDVPHQNEDVIDDVAYPADVLKRAQRTGVNITGIPVAKEFQRLINKRRKWWQETTDGKIAVPWGFYKDFPDKPIFKSFFEDINRDLGCVELVFLEQKELTETKWENGILVMFDSKWDDCWTPFGVVPGSTGSKGQITKYGVPPMWQLMRFSTKCLHKGMVHHMVLHALGFHHLQTRPDRDDFIQVNSEATEKLKDAHNWRMMNWVVWQESGLPFDHRSILMHSAQPGIMTRKDGSLWSNQMIRLTTTDALQVQWFYCDKDEGQGVVKNFKYKGSIRCPKKDELGEHLDVFSDRVCDGYRDCPNGEDEDGTLGTCVKNPETSPSGCCLNIVLNHKYDNMCKRTGQLNGKDTYDCTIYKERDFIQTRLVWFPFMAVFKTSGWVMIEPGVQLTPASISVEVVKGIIAFQSGNNTCPPEGIWSDYNDQFNDRASTYCQRTDEDLCMQTEYQNGIETAIDQFQKEFSTNSKSIFSNKNKNKSRRLFKKMKTMKKRPFRNCARANHAIPSSQTGGVCDFMGLTHQIIHAQTTRNGTVSQLRNSEVIVEKKPLQLRHLEVINEICRRYVGYLIWAHEPCKSVPTTIDELAKKCEKFNVTFFKSEKLGDSL